VGIRELLEYFTPVSAESYIHLSPIFGASLADDQFLRPEAIDQSNGAVVGNLQLFSQLSDINGISSRKAFDGEQSLVLARRYPGGFGCRLTKVEKLSEIIAECSQGLILCLGDAGGGSWFAGVQFKEDLIPRKVPESKG
jgi:hypothetical protein